MEALATATVEPDVALSVVVPVKDEQENVAELVRQILVHRERYPLEIVFVDDGSTDGTLQELRRLREVHREVRIIVLKRNWGKSPAMAAGFRTSRGRHVITMDGDLQDDPSEIPKFMEKLDAGYDLVCGWRVERQDKADKRLPSKLFNWLAGRTVGTRVHDFNCGFKGYSGSLARHINLYGDMHRYVPVLASIHGARITEVPVHHRARHAGRSKYGARRLARGMLDLLTVTFLTTFVDRPLHFFGRIGAWLGLAGFALGAYLVALKYVTGAGIGDRPLLALSVLLLILGVQFVSLGLLGEFLVYRLHQQTPLELMAEER